MAALLFAVDPAGLQGIAVRSRPGPLRDAWTDFLRVRLASDAPWRRLPLSINDDRLIGGLDLAATLNTQKPVLQRGLLADADGGTVVIPMAERLEVGKAARIAAVMDKGHVRVEREGFAARHASRFSLVLFDESDRDENGPPPVLLERAAFSVALVEDPEGGVKDLFADFGPQDIAAARDLLTRVEPSERIAEAVCGAAAVLGVASARAALFALRAARASAALDGRTSLRDEDLTVAARLVLGPRATRVPMEEPDAEDMPEPQAPAEQPQEADSEKSDSALDPEMLQDMIVSAARAVLPAEVLASLAARQTGKAAAEPGGRKGPTVKSVLRGRPIGVREGRPAPGQRLSVIDTLRAAAPWQSLRRRSRTEGTGPVIEVRPGDFRLRRMKQSMGTVTVFVVDASGSAALHRLAEAKGAVELLLAECYVRRDSVALITFSGRGVDLALPPTRSLVRAKRRLIGLPGGGGTPLSAAIDAAADMGERIRRQGQRAVLVFLTDGKANISRDGTADRRLAAEEAHQAASRLAGQDLSTLFVDIAPRSREAARDLAGRMGARYLALPHADAAGLNRAVGAAAA